MFIRILDAIASFFILSHFLFLYSALRIISFFRKYNLKERKEKKLLYFVIFSPDSIKKLNIFDEFKYHVTLNNYFKKVYLYHLDFKDSREEKSWITKDIYWRQFKVHNILPKLKRTSALITELKLLLEGFNLIIKEKINIIQAQDAHILGINAWLLSRLTKTRFIVEICSNYEIKNRASKGLSVPMFCFASIERLIERTIMKKADMLCGGHQYYLDCGLIPSSCKHKYFNFRYAVSNKHLKPLEERKNIKKDLKISPTDYLALYVGRLNPEKYSLDLIHCFKKVYEQASNTYFMIIGDGLLKEQIISELMKDIPKKNIFYFKSKTQDELLDIYSTSDVIILPSGGRTLVEASFAGAPIIAYDFEWHYEVIKSGKTGKLVKFRDYLALANEAYCLLKNPEFAKYLGRNARNFAINNFKEEIYLGKKRKMYQVLSQR